MLSGARVLVIEGDMCSLSSGEKLVDLQKIVKKYAKHKSDDAGPYAFNSMGL